MDGTLIRSACKTQLPGARGCNEKPWLTLASAKIEGRFVPAGSYGLFFVINKDNTGEVVLSKEYQAWGSFFYDAKADQMRAKIQLRDIPHVELLTYDFINSQNGAELVLNWGENKKKKQSRLKLNSRLTISWWKMPRRNWKDNAVFSARSYHSRKLCVGKQSKSEQAIGWTDQVIQNNKTFQALNIKAGLLRANR